MKMKKQETNKKNKYEISVRKVDLALIFVYIPTILIFVILAICVDKWWIFGSLCSLILFLLFICVCPKKYNPFWDLTYDLSNDNNNEEENK